MVHIETQKVKVLRANQKNAKVLSPLLLLLLAQVRPTTGRETLARPGHPM